MKGDGQMATIEELVDQMRTARGVLVSDRDRLTAEISRLDNAIEALTATPAGETTMIPATPVPPKVKVAKPLPAAKPGKKPPAPVKCPDCSFECTPQNMWRHAKVCTGTQAPAPAPAATGGTHGKVLACTEEGCEATFNVDQFSRLNTHTIGQHGRRPPDEERTPVLAGAVAA